MSKTILAITHGRQAKIGKISTILTEQGYDIEIRCILAGDTLPSPKNYKAVIIMGGMMSVHDTDTFPGLMDECKWIQNVINDDVHFLGVCLGAQLLSQSLGGEVARHPEEIVEAGYHNVEATQAGQNFFPTGNMNFYQWHNEGFTIPDKCTLLAQSKAFPHQAFMLNPKTIGLQFHPEATKETIDAWSSAKPTHLLLKGAQPREQHLQGYELWDERVSEWLKQFLKTWLQAQ